MTRFSSELRIRPPETALPWWHYALWPALVAVILTSLGYWAYTPDDGYITLTYIKGVARTGRFIFSGSTPSHGETSPLWVIVNAIPVCAGAPPMLTIKLLAYLCTVAAVLGLVQLARPYGSWAAVCVGLVLCCDPWLLRWAVSGLETSFACTALVWTLVVLRKKRWLTACVMASFVPLIRPELCVFTAVIGMSILLAWWRGQVRGSRVFLAVVVLGLPTVLWIAYCWHSFGSIIPNTVISKTLMYRRNKATSSLGFRIDRFKELLAAENGLIVLAAGISVFWSWQAWSIRDREIRFAIFAWPVLLFGTYFFTGSVIVSRYLVPGSIFLFLIGVVWLATISRRLAGGATFLSCCLSVFLTVTRVVPETHEYARNFPHAAELPEWLNQHAGNGDIVATVDVGYLGFYNRSGYDILDLVGLVTPQMLVPPSQQLAYLRKQRPKYYIDRDIVENCLTVRGYLNPEQFGPAADQPHATFVRAAFLAGATHLTHDKGPDFYYSLYRLDWNGPH